MVLGFIRVLVGSLGRVIGSLGSSGSLGLTLARLGVVGFIRVRVGSLGALLWVMRVLRYRVGSLVRD